MAWPDAGAQSLPGVTRGVGTGMQSGGAVLGGPAEVEAARGSWSGGGGRARGGEEVGGVCSFLGGGRWGLGRDIIPEASAGPRLGGRPRDWALGRAVPEGSMDSFSKSAGKRPAA